MISRQLNDILIHVYSESIFIGAAMGCVTGIVYGTVHIVNNIEQSRQLNINWKNTAHFVFSVVGGIAIGAGTIAAFPITIPILCYWNRLG